jgi:hypothetical protein
MRYKPFLGSISPKTQNIRNRGEEVWKVVSMDGNGMKTLQLHPPIETLSLRGAHLLGNHVNHQGEMRQKV